LADALRKAGVAAEVFFLESGGHGFGMRREEWTGPCRDWLQVQGFLTPGG
jgi:acetyl esterase/lipase